MKVMMDLPLKAQLSPVAFGQGRPTAMTADSRHSAAGIPNNANSATLGSRFDVIQKNDCGFEATSAAFRQLSPASDKICLDQNSRLGENKARLLRVNP